MVLGQEYSVVSNYTSNMKMAEAASDVTITFNLNTMKMKVEGNTASTEITYALHGQLTGANWATTVMTKDPSATPETWTYTCTPAVPVGQTLVTRQEDGNMSLAKAAKNVTVTLDTNTSKIKIEGEEDVEIVTYVINSSLTEETWSIADMTEGADGEWTYTVTPVIAEGEMLVQKMVNGTAKEYYKAAATDLL